MSRSVLLLSLLSFASFANCQSSDVDVPCMEWFPSSDEFFQPIFADPRELGYALRMTTPVGKKNLAEIGLGDYLGIVRVPLGRGWQFQVNIGGGVIGRFDISMPTNDFQVADFTAAVPLEFCWKRRHAFRLAYWHISSHLGDDFIKRKDPPIGKHFTDEVKLVWSFFPFRFLRLCAGGAHAFNLLPRGKRNRIEAALELKSKSFCGGRARLVLGAGVHSAQRSGWKPDLTSKMGLRVAYQEHQRRRTGGLTLFLEFFSGRLYYQQFGSEKETHWTLGLGIEMGGLQ